MLKGDSARRCFLAARGHRDLGEALTEGAPDGRGPRQEGPNIEDRAFPLVQDYPEEVR